MRAIIPKERNRRICSGNFTRLSNQVRLRADSCWELASVIFELPEIQSLEMQPYLPAVYPTCCLPLYSGFNDSHQCIEATSYDYDTSYGAYNYYNNSAPPHGANRRSFGAHNNNSTPHDDVEPHHSGPPRPAAGPAWQDWQPSRHSMVPPRPSPGLHQNRKPQDGSSAAVGDSNRARRHRSRAVLGLGGRGQQREAPPGPRFLPHGTPVAARSQPVTLPQQEAEAAPGLWFLSHGEGAAQRQSISPGIPHIPDQSGRNIMSQVTSAAFAGQIERSSSAPSGGHATASNQQPPPTEGQMQQKQQPPSMCQLLMELDSPPDYEAAAGPLPRLSTSSSDGRPRWQRTLSAPWPGGSISAASQPPSDPLLPTAPSADLSHHAMSAPWHSPFAASTAAGSTMGGKRRGEAVMMQADWRPWACAQQQKQQPSEEWRPQSCVQQRQQPSEDRRLHTCAQRQPSDEWRPQSCAQQWQPSEEWRPQPCAQQQQQWQPSEDWRPQPCAQQQQQQQPSEEWRSQPYSAQQCPSAWQRQQGGVWKTSHGLAQEGRADECYCGSESATAGATIHQMMLADARMVIFMPVMPDHGAPFPPTLPPSKPSMPDRGAPFLPPSNPSISSRGSRGAQAVADHARQQQHDSARQQQHDSARQQQHDRQYCSAAAAATTAVVTEQPRALATDWNNGAAIPIIAAVAADSDRGDPDDLEAAAAEWPWWVQLLEE